MLVTHVAVRVMLAVIAGAAIPMPATANSTRPGHTMYPRAGSRRVALSRRPAPIRPISPHTVRERVRIYLFARLRHAISQGGRHAEHLNGAIGLVTTVASSSGSARSEAIRLAAHQLQYAQQGSSLRPVSSELVRLQSLLLDDREPSYFRTLADNEHLLPPPISQMLASMAPGPERDAWTQRRGERAAYFRHIVAMGEQNERQDDDLAYWHFQDAASSAPDAEGRAQLLERAAASLDRQAAEVWTRVPDSSEDRRSYEMSARILRRSATLHRNGYLHAPMRILRPLLRAAEADYATQLSRIGRGFRPLLVKLDFPFLQDLASMRRQETRGTRK